jgi:methyl-accepting chemotaxis protein
MKTMTVGRRLALSFGTIIVLLLIIVAIGIAKLGTLNEGTASIVQKRWPNIEASNAIMYQSTRIAIALRNMMLTPDAADRRKQQEEIVAARGIIADKVQFLEKAIVLPKGKELLAKVLEERRHYLAGQEQLIAIINTDKPDEARTFLVNNLRPILKNYQEALDGLIQFQVQLIDTAGKEAESTYQGVRALMIGLGAFAVLLSLAIGFLITRNLTRQLGGEPDYAAAIARRIAEGDLTVKVELQPGDTSSMLHAMRGMRDNLANIVSQVRDGTNTIASASGQIAAGSMDLSSRTEEQASSLEETASSMEELTSTVKQNADNARQANSLASVASEVAGRGGAVVAKVVDTMGSINESSRKIVDIISVIDGIAFQTNILALNAAVEAARAGEQGRGFAVVASEVRNLAQRSSAAAREIKQLIDSSVEKVDVGAQLVDQAGATMQELLDSVKRVTDIMGEITSASAEQTAGIEQINQAITQMDDVTQQNAALVEEAAAAAGSMQDQSARLVSLVSTFKIDGGTPAKHAAAAISAKAPASTSRHARPAIARGTKVAPPKRPQPAAADNWEEF